MFLPFRGPIGTVCKPLPQTTMVEYVLTFSTCDCTSGRFVQASPAFGLAIICDYSAAYIKPMIEQIDSRMS
jgi:hypothetical protein